jgi:protocatechuate 3,4-dioxygenase beta subunit
VGAAPAASRVGCVLTPEMTQAAGGVYSGLGTGGSSRTFMRGLPKTDKSGLSIFRTVYPGWYQGHTVHLHRR